MLRLIWAYMSARVEVPNLTIALDGRIDSFLLSNGETGGYIFQDLASWRLSALGAS